jgi:hypothetical protein
VQHVEVHLHVGGLDLSLANPKANGVGVQGDRKEGLSRPIWLRGVVCKNHNLKIDSFLRKICLKRFTKIDFRETLVF